MDPISTSAITAAVGGLLKPTADEVGARLLATLKKLVRRVPRSRREPGTQLAKLDLSPEELDAEAFAAELVAATDEDAALARDLRAWMIEAQAVLQGGSVSNANSGTVQGPLIQGRDFSGPMTFS